MCSEHVASQVLQEMKIKQGRGEGGILEVERKQVLQILGRGVVQMSKGND